MARSFRNHYKKRNPTGDSIKHSIKEFYEYDVHCNSRWSSANSNMLSHIRNSLVTGMNKGSAGTLPRYIIIVLDGDLITYLDYKHEGVTTLLGMWIEWLVAEFSEIIKVHQNQLPGKSKRYDPFWYWVSAPTHSCFSKECNALRVKFNLSLESVI